VFAQFGAIAGLSVLLIVATLWRSRRQELSARYAVGWLLLGLLGVVSGLLIPIVSPIAGWLSVTPGVIVFTTATILLVLISMQLSVSISGASRRVELLALQHALSAYSGPRPARDKPLIIIPAWNESANVGAVVRPLRLMEFEVLVINDGSTDQTSSAARSAGALVLDLPFNIGVGAAIRCGLQFAQIHNVHEIVQCDADGQHPTDLVTSLLDHLRDSDSDLVIGSRFAEGKPAKMRIGKSRRLAMKVLSTIASRATGTRITDSTSGFRAISQPLLGHLAQNMPSYYLGDTFETYVAAGRAGYQIREIPTPIGERLTGVSSASVRSSLLMISKAVLLTTARLGIRLPQRPSNRE